jgi:hypothetical protein
MFHVQHLSRISCYTVHTVLNLSSNSTFHIENKCCVTPSSVCACVLLFVCVVCVCVCVCVCEGGGREGEGESGRAAVKVVMRQGERILTKEDS